MLCDKWEYEFNGTRHNERIRDGRYMLQYLKFGAKLSIVDLHIKIIMKYRTSKRVAIQPRPSRSINTLKNQSAHVSLKAKKGLHEMNDSYFFRDYDDWLVNRVHYAVMNLLPWRSSRYAGPWDRCPVLCSIRWIFAVLAHVNDTTTHSKRASATLPLTTALFGQNRPCNAHSERRITTSETRIRRISEQQISLVELTRIHDHSFYEISWLPTSVCIQ